MGPPCGHDPSSVAPGGPFERGKVCARCWLWVNRPDSPAVLAWKRTVEPPAPRPVSSWPFLARRLANLRDPSDRGLGDTVARHIDRLGGEWLKRFYKRLTGGDCGCADRKAALNRRFPYPTAPE
jgi:hypothetical protein